MHEVGYPFGKIKLVFDGTNAIEPTAVFEKTCNFDELVKEIVMQSELYMQQKPIPLSTSGDKLKAFIGMNYVMDFFIFLLLLTDLNCQAIES